MGYGSLVLLGRKNWGLAAPQSRRPERYGQRADCNIPVTKDPGRSCPATHIADPLSMDDLKEHLADLYRDLSSGAIPAVRRHSELDVV